MWIQVGGRIVVRPIPGSNPNSPPRLDKFPEIRN